MQKRRTRKFLVRNLSEETSMPKHCALGADWYRSQCQHGQNRSWSFKQECKYATISCQSSHAPSTGAGKLNIVVPDHSFVKNGCVKFSFGKTPGTTPMLLLNFRNLVWNQNRIRCQKPNSSTTQLLYDAHIPTTDRARMLMAHEHVNHFWDAI